MRQDKAISHCNQGRPSQEEPEDTKGATKIEGQTTQWAKKNGQTAIDKRTNRKPKIEQHESKQNPGVHPGAPEELGVSTPPAAPTVQPQSRTRR